MRKIQVVIGSGVSSGNTGRLANAFIKGAQEKGHHVERVFFGDDRLQGSKGCGACQKGVAVYYRILCRTSIHALKKADTIVFASSLYFWMISVALKTYMERLYALSKKDIYPKRDCVLLMSAGNDSFWTFEQAVSYYHFVTKAIGWSDIGSYLAKGRNRKGRDVQCSTRCA